MVGSGASDRSKEAVGMMALHEALRSVCLNSDWTYSVFWTIRPRPRVRGGNGCKVGDDNGSLMLMWEDGFCRGRVAECLEEMDGEDPVRKAFSKMSIQLYNYGEGLMGKVASDKCHKWVFKEPTECEPNISNYWQSSFDALPPEWTDQFESGIQTIAVIQAGHGLLQLGSCKIIPEDLHFVLRMRHTFESLGYQSGFYLSQLFSSNRSTSPSSTVPLKQPSISIRPPAPLFNWGPRPMPSAPAVLTSPNYQNSVRLGIPPSKDESHMFLLPHSSEARMEDMMGDHEADIKWPNGLSFFNALTGRADDSRLLFNADNIGNKLDQNHHPLNLEVKTSNPNSDAASSLHTNGRANPNEFLSLDSHHPDSVHKMENKFKRSFTLPARMASSSSSTSLEQHQNNPGEFRNEAGMCSDVMETFLE
ncbi:protein RICE SALT SENSITIVE 3-like [Ipomoea triloba]|uniref:protein RICE SALT SENSITIVE 3-like n=1 Tax=Ipomoea triloba TaxID=35885 RepID=UPI00125E454E|nr:protein RICE SALT SENSITIVE 3-like [Ipomoea triloba]